MSKSMISLFLFPHLTIIQILEINLNTILYVFLFVLIIKIEDRRRELQSWKLIKPPKKTNDYKSIKCSSSTMKWVERREGGCLNQFCLNIHSMIITMIADARIETKSLRRSVFFRVKKTIKFPMFDIYISVTEWC